MTTNDSDFRLTRGIGFVDIASLERTGPETIEPSPPSTASAKTDGANLIAPLAGSNRNHTVGCGKRVRQNYWTNRFPRFRQNQGKHGRAFLKSDADKIGHPHDCRWLGPRLDMGEYHNRPFHERPSRPTGPDCAGLPPAFANPIKITTYRRRWSIRRIPPLSKIPSKPKNENFLNRRYPRRSARYMNID